MSVGTKLFALFGEIGIQGVDKAKEEIKGVSEETKQARDKMVKDFQTIGQKAGELGKNMALGLAGVVTGAVAMVEGTREFRQGLGKLETAFKTTNQATGTATKTFKTLYGVLGDDDKTIEAANHLAMITNNEKDLGEWTDILTGVYATFGDSLPVEGLAEAANETMRVGQVTGPLADALNWAGVSEDEFNEKLLECANNQEREALIRETLTGLYGEASKTYKDVNGDIIKNNKAQADMNLKMAEISERLQPLITQGKELVVTVLEKISPLITWIIDNINILAPIVLGFLGTLFALNIASKVTSLVGIVKTLITAFTSAPTVISGVKAAMSALNLTMAANPIGLIITAIGLLITIFVTLWNNCEGFRNFWIGLWENIKNVLAPVIEWFKQVFQQAWEYIKGIWDAVKPYFEMLWNNIKAVFSVVKDVLGGYFKAAWNNIKIVWDLVVGYFKMLWENIKTIFSVVKAVLSGDFKGAWDGIKRIWDNVKGYFTQVWNGVKNIFGNVGSFFKNAFTSAWNGIKSIFSNVGSFFSGIWNTIKSVFTNIGQKVGSAISGAFKSAINGLLSTAERILNVPIRAINTAIGLLNNIPGVSIEKLKEFSLPRMWQGGVLEKGQVGLLEGNGAEAVVPLHNNEKWISAVAKDMSNSIGNNNSGVYSKDIEEKLDRLLALLSNYLPVLSNRQVVLSTGELVGAMVNPMDKALGELASKRERGY